MKTPDEIKKALRICSGKLLDYCDACNYCNWSSDCACNSRMCADALDYIQQLENHIGELTEKVAQLEEAQPKWISVEDRMIIEHDLKIAFEDGYLAGVEAAQPKWIPVTERLPNDKETVLTYKNGIIETQVYEKMRNGWNQCGWFWSMATVTHWMPLPEPPKEEA